MIDKKAIKHLLEDKHILSSSSQRNVEKSQIILYQGSTNHHVFIIKSGYVKVHDITTEGKDKIMLLLGPGDIFPVVWSFEKDSLHYFYTAYTDTQLRVGSLEEFISNIDKTHHNTRALLHYLVGRSQELFERIECIENTGSINKVAQVLSYLAHTHGEKTAKKVKILPPLTHQTIAELAGLARETTSLVISDLEEKKILKQNKHFLIDLDALTKLLAS